MSKALYTKIKTFCTSLTKSYVKLHGIAVECLIHAEQHGDARPMLALLTGLPKATYREGIVVWLNKFSPVRVNGDFNKIGVLSADDKRYVAFDVEAANAMPFWDIPEVAEHLAKAPMSIDKLVKQVSGFKATKIKQIDKQLADGLIDDDTARGMKAYLERVEIRVAA